MRALSLISTLAFASLASAQTIADLVTQNAAAQKITKAAALVASHPEWAAAGTTHSLFVPVDTATPPTGLPDGDIGYVFTDAIGLDFDAGDSNTNVVTNYWPVIDTQGQKRFIYDDYIWGKETTFNIHLRTSTQSGLVVTGFRATNGFLFIMDTAFAPPADNLSGAKANQLDQFFTYAQKAGVADLINGLKDVTLWVPNNDAFAAASAQLNALTNDQLAYTLLSHITQKTTYTSALQAAPYPSILQNGAASTVMSNGTTWHWNNIALAPPAADIMTASGVFQPLTKVLIPTSFGSVALAPGVSSGPVASATTTAASTSAAATSAGATPAATSVAPAAASPTAKNSAGSVVPALGAVVAGIGALVAGL